MSKKLLLISTIIGSTISVPAFAEDAIAERISKLEQELKLLSRQAEIAKEEEVAAKAKQPIFEYNKKGFNVTSADGRNQLNIRGNAQIDGRFFLNDKNNIGRDEFLARRLRPIITGKSDNASFRLMPDFAGGNARLLDAHVDYKISDPLQLRFGKFKTPISLERLQSQTDLLFIERGFANSLAPSRDFGAQLYGDIDQGLFEYQIGVFNGGPDTAAADNDGDDGKDYVARVFGQPFKNSNIYELRGLGLGVAGSVGEREGSASSSTTSLGSYASPGQQRILAYSTGALAADNTFADGTHWRLYPQGYYYYGPFGAMAEYAISNQEVTKNGVSDELQHKAWQLDFSYVLTGEDASYKSLTPSEPFNLQGGGIGAWEVAARVGGIDFDNDTFPTFASLNNSVTEAKGFGLGLNWYLNERVKWQLNYDQTQFEGGAAGGNDRPTEHAVFTRVQYQF